MESAPNMWAILVAALSGFMIGGLWYSPALFGNAWMKAAGLDEEKVKSANMGKIFGFSFVFNFIMSYCLAMFLNDPSIDLTMGAFYGFLTGFGWVALAIAVNSLYEQKSWSYIIINGGYWSVAFTVMGVILGAWK